MKKLKTLLMAVICLPLLMGAQESYRMVELSYMKVKPGMNAKFEAAIKAHNEKYHKEGKYGSALYSIVTGNEAGWYVWTMGGFTYTDLDGRPAAGAHDDDWTKTIEPFIAEYGRVEFWRMNDKLSFRKENDDKMLSIWWMDITRGEYYRFKEFMLKVRAIHEKKSAGISVYDNEFSQNDGRDVAIVWSMPNWADMDKEDWKMQVEFDAMYGEGSWQLALEEWKDVMEAMTQEIWKEL
jgi:hypothetical protein